MNTDIQLYFDKINSNILLIIKCDVHNSDQNIPNLPKSICLSVILEN